MCRIQKVSGFVVLFGATEVYEGWPLTLPLADVTLPV